MYSSDRDEEKRPMEGNFWRIPTWFEDLSETKLNQLKLYHAELIKFNGRMNLISPRTERRADQVHFADSILGGRAILEHSDREEFLDIGSGNGLPGLVMAILDPNRRFILIDRDSRKVQFLKHCVYRLGLKNAVVQHTDIKQLGENIVDAAVSRGFANLPQALLAARKICKEDAQYYHFKGESWFREVSSIPSQLCSYWAPSLVKEYDLPDNGPHLVVLMAKKIA